LAELLAVKPAILVPIKELEPRTDVSTLVGNLLGHSLYDHLEPPGLYLDRLVLLFLESVSLLLLGLASPLLFPLKPPLLLL